MPWVEVTDPEEMAVAEAMLGGNRGSTPPATVMGLRERLQLQAGGLPVLRQENDPFSRLADPKQQEMARRISLTAGTRAIEQDSDAVTKARENLRLINEFDDLNRRGISGGFSGWLNERLPAFAQGVGPGSREDVQRMDMLSAKLAPQNRIPGSGAVSDFDARQFLRMTGGLSKDQATNARYANAVRMAEQAAIDRQSFREAFLQANSTLVGADAMWQQYANAEPIFDQSGNVRSNRMGWQEYFARRAQRALAGQPVDAPRRPQQRQAAQQPTAAKARGYEVRRVR